MLQTTTHPNAYKASKIKKMTAMVATTSIDLDLARAAPERPRLPLLPTARRIGSSSTLTSYPHERPRPSGGLCVRSGSEGSSPSHLGGVGGLSTHLGSAPISLYRAALRNVSIEVELSGRSVSSNRSTLLTGSVYFDPRRETATTRSILATVGTSPNSTPAATTVAPSVERLLRNARRRSALRNRSFATCPTATSR